MALQEAVKPAVDGLALQSLARAAEQAGDSATAGALASLLEDAAWHRDWSRSFLGLTSGSGRGASPGAVERLCVTWSTRAEEAVAPLRERLGGGGAP